MNQSALAKKLQIKPNHRILLLDAPDGHAASLAPLPEGAALATVARGSFDGVHLFVRQARELEKAGPKAIAAVKQGGVLWISYPKKGSGVETDLTRDAGWGVIKAAGWGPVAQVAIDDTWSALRFKPEAEVARKPGSAAASWAVAGATKRPAAKTSATKAGTTAKKAAVEAPVDLAEALAKSEGARATWASMAPSHRREYVRWLDEAKKAETRARRLEKAIEMIAAGVKDRNAKYAR